MKPTTALGWIVVVVVIVGVIAFGATKGQAIFRQWQVEAQTNETPAKVEPDPVQSSAKVEADQPEVRAKENAQIIIAGTVSEGTILTFGDLGTYKCVYDTNRKQWTIGQWTENQISTGTMTLADLKRDGGKISFTMPANGWINNSAGKLFVDGKQWDLGNYGEIDRMTQETLIQKGQIISVEYGPQNDSAGFQIWFQN